MKASLSENEILALKSYCFENDIEELYVFGSVAKNTNTEDSDIDFMVTISPGAPISIFKLIQIEEDLSKLLNRKVDLITTRSVLESKNRVLKESVLTEAVRVV